MNCKSQPSIANTDAGNGIMQFLIILIYICSSCAPSRLDKSLYKAGEYPEYKSPQSGNEYLKVHMNSGDLYVLSQWEIDVNKRQLQGSGEKYNYSREVDNAEGNKFTLQLSDIALFEKNRVVKSKGENGQSITMAVFSSLNILITLPCLADPKSCFGSCPTYYTSNGSEMVIQGEGFSSSIARAYETVDIDMMHNVDVDSDTFDLEIRNEALETHYIRYCDLIVIPKTESEKVVCTENGRFFHTGVVLPPIRGIASEGDILEMVKYPDRYERYSLADSVDLTESETIDLVFNNPRKKTALLIASRQTLMTTYLFYQSMAYMGSQYIDLVQKIENGNQWLKEAGKRMFDLLGGIEVFVNVQDDEWIKAGEIREMGPIAIDMHSIELPVIEQEFLRIRLRMTKGLWRLDYLALAELDRQVDPIRLSPVELYNNDKKDHEALDALNDTSQYLVTYPREVFTAKYLLPENEDMTFEYFIESKGYYIEWMRESWLNEENRSKVLTLLTQPSKYLRNMAPLYKKAEPHMESIFWNSKFTNQQ